MSAIRSVWSRSRRFGSDGGAARTARRTGVLLAAFAAAGMFALSAAAPARAGALYRWETEDGTLAFADDVKRIPDRYRSGATEILPERLEDYSRFTPTDQSAQQIHADRLAERLDGLRVQTRNEADDTEPIEIVEPRRTHPLDGIALESEREQVGRRRVDTSEGPRWRRTTRRQTVDAPVPILDVTPDPDSDAPVIVERVRARSRDSLVTRKITVVRQGDRVLSVIKPRARHSSSDWPFEEEFERPR